jgi:acyl-CoA reductase-like NAD-dependent aldehyde dehydrogenase
LIKLRDRLVRERLQVLHQLAVVPPTSPLPDDHQPGDEEDIDEAVKAARKAFEEGKWPALGPHQRARYLFRITELIEAHTDELAELITLDNGKPIGESLSEVARTAETFRYYGGWAAKIYGETNPSDLGFFNYALREPIGVCGQIIPWNGPLSAISWKVAPALACGNTVVPNPPSKRRCQRCAGVS